MPIYKLTFDDESEAYLAHHGVKGMHWGVRSAETMAKYGMKGEGGGGGGVVDDEENEEGFEIDPDEFGFEDTPEGREAAYEESGLRSDMTREEARKIVEENRKKDTTAPKTNQAMMNQRKARKMEDKLVNSLPTAKAKAAKASKSSSANKSSGNSRASVAKALGNRGH